MQAPSLCSDVTIPVWVLRGVSVSFWEEGFVRGIFGWTWLLQPLVCSDLWGFFFPKPIQGRYACSDVLTPLAGSFVFSFQHALLPSCIQSFTSPAQSLLAFWVTCFPSEATSTSSGRIFDQGPFPNPLKHFATPTIATVVGHTKHMSQKHSAFFLISPILYHVHKL